MLRPDPRAHAALLERLAEVALLISLFAVGLRLGVPLRDRRWRLPLRLAFLSMAAMVALVTAIGVFWLQLPLGVAVLLGAILAPTDPVLASDVQSETGTDPDRLGFSLAAEGGLNDGAAFPFVMLGLGLLGLHELGPGLVGWWSIDLLWATLGGMAIGAALGAASGRLVLHLRIRHGEAVGLDEFLGLGLVAMAYGIAQFSLASGFLAVFAAGMALQRVREHPRPHTPPAGRGGWIGRPLLRQAGHAFAPCQPDDARFGAGLQCATGTSGRADAGAGAGRDAGLCRALADAAVVRAPGATGAAAAVGAGGHAGRAAESVAAGDGRLVRHPRHRLAVLPAVRAARRRRRPRSPIR